MASTVFWLVDSSITSADALHRIRTQLTSLVDTLSLFNDTNDCIDQIERTLASCIVLIVSDCNGEQLIRRLPSRDKLHSIYVLCEQRANPRHWLSVCHPTPCILTDLTSVCERIRMEDKARDTGIAFDVVGPSSAKAGEDRNRQEAMFMYGQLLKEVLTEISYSDVDKTAMFGFLRDKHKDDPAQLREIDELEVNYSAKDAIVYYTKYPFLYKTLNDALRNGKVDVMVALGVFIKDLHFELAQKHETTTKPEGGELFRGVLLSSSDFERKLKGKEGGLLSINEFLSTSSNIAVAEMFAGNPFRDGNVEVIFRVNLDRSSSANAVYVNIAQISQHKDEDEFLFTMGSVFRIDAIEQVANTRKWYVYLSLTADHDEQLTVLTEYYRNYFPGKDFGTLCCLLFSMGNCDQFARVSRIAIERTTEPDSLQSLYCLRNLMCLAPDHMVEASQKLELAPKYGQPTTIGKLGDLLDLLTENSKALAEADTDSSLPLLTKILQLSQTIPIVESDPEIKLMYELVPALVSLYQNRFSEGKAGFEQVLKKAETSLPDLHPTKARISFIWGLMSRSDPNGALEHFCHAEKIAERSLPPGNPTVTISRIIRTVFEKSSPSHAGMRSSLKGNTSTGEIMDNPVAALGEVLSLFPRSQISLVFSLMVPTSNESNGLPESLLACLLRGKRFMDTKNLTEALTAFQEADRIVTSTSSMRSGLQACYILTNITQIHFMQNNDDEAFRMLNRCSGLLTQITDQAHVSKLMDFLGEIVSKLFVRGAKRNQRHDYQQALRLFQNVASVQEIFFADGHADLAKTYRCIGICLSHMKMHSDAVDYFQTALECSKCVQIEPKCMVLMWRGLGANYYYLNRFEEALCAYVECLQFLQHLDPPDYKQLSQLQILIGVIFQSLGHAAEAIIHYRCAIDIYTTHLPEQDTKLAKVWLDVGKLYMSEKKNHDALAAFDQALQIQMLMTVPDPLVLARTYRNIGLIHQAESRSADALLYFEKLLEVQTATHPPDDPAFDDTYLSIGLVLGMQKRYSKSRRCMQRALSGYRRYLSESDARLQWALQHTLLLHNIPDGNHQTSSYATSWMAWISERTRSAKTLLDQDKYEEALVTLDECLSLEQALLPNDASELSQTLLLMIKANYELKRYVDLSNCLERLLQIQMKHLPDTVTEAISTCLCLGLSYYQSNQYDEVIGAYEQALEFQLNILSSNDIAIANTYGLIGSAYSVAGHGEHALEYFLKCHDIQTLLLPSDDERVLAVSKTISLLADSFR